MKKLIPLFILILAALGCKDEAPKNNQPAAETSPSVRTPPNEVKQFVNLSALAGKSTQEVEKILGKAKTAKKITDISSTLFDDEREYQFPQADESYTILVRYFKGKAVQFLTLAPEGDPDAAKFVERFRFNVKDLKPETYSMTTNWQGNVNGIEFEKISAMKMSGNNYNHLTVIVKK